MCVCALQHIVLDRKRVETCALRKEFLTKPLELHDEYESMEKISIKTSLGQVGSDKLDTEQCSRRYTVLFCSLA